LHTAPRCQTLAQRTPENLDIRSLAQTKLVLVVGLDLSQFRRQHRIVDWKPTQASERFGCRLGFALLDEESRGFRQDEHAGDQDQSPGELHGDGDAVAAGVVAVLG
jgi:hypothetical protein